MHAPGVATATSRTNKVSSSAPQGTEAKETDAKVVFHRVANDSSRRRGAHKAERRRRRRRRRLLTPVSSRRDPVLALVFWLLSIIHPSFFFTLLVSFVSSFFFLLSFSPSLCSLVFPLGSFCLSSFEREREFQKDNFEISTIKQTRKHGKCKQVSEERKRRKRTNKLKLEINVILKSYLGNTVSSPAIVGQGGGGSRSVRVRSTKLLLFFFFQNTASCVFYFLFFVVVSFHVVSKRASKQRKM